MRFDGSEFEGKTVVITGGGGILGREFCKGFSSVGAKVVALDCDLESAQNAVDNLDGQALALQCNISDAASIKEAMEDIAVFSNNIDVLINNAGSKSHDVRAFFEPFERYSLQTWREVMSVNIDGMFLMSQAVGNRMLKQQDGGAIVNVSSIYGLVSPDPRIYEGSQYLGGEINSPAVYSASKAAVVGLTKWLAVHWAEKGIRVNAIAPGGVSSGQNQEFEQKYSSHAPINRMAKAKEMVAPTMFLASSHSSYVTGQVLAADGGWTAW